MNNQQIGVIGHGLVVFVGVHLQDTEATVHWMAKKLINLRVFPDADGKMNQSIIENKGALLIISQFTLYGDCTKGNRPDFLAAAPAAHANHLYEQLITQCAQYAPVQTGKFGACMSVELVNEGPVTLLIEKD